jgi:hypothetical protein
VGEGTRVKSIAVFTAPPLLISEMSAVKVVFKRSSILGKRPTTANLTAGEIALNTNGNEPGLFFEVNDGSVVKAGPTAYLPEAPTTTPSRGEMWVDTDTNALSIGTSSRTWQTVAAPFLSGTGGYAVFVAPEFPNSSDSISNDGQTTPFQTLNRAIIQVANQIIQDYNRGYGPENNRYEIFVATGRSAVINGPGVAVPDFNVNFSTVTDQVTQAQLQQFNPVSGGLIVPRGVSIIGMDMVKCEIVPDYVPTYTHPDFDPGYTLAINGPEYTNQPLSAILKWSGNSYLSNFTFTDKVVSNDVVSVSESDNNLAVFRTLRPHGLQYNEFVNIQYVSTQTEGSFAPGAYYVDPIDSFTFIVSFSSLTSINGGSYVPFSSLPVALSTATGIILTVAAIYPYYKPEDGVSYELHNYSHHRLSCIRNASIDELNEFYTKVQLAFPGQGKMGFNGTVNTSIASPPETTIVAPTLLAYPNNLTTNDTTYLAPIANAIIHKSNYGLCGIDADGTVVSGFRSSTNTRWSSIVLQKDPAAYEVYADANQNWVTLTSFVQSTFPTGTPITAVPTLDQLQVLNQEHIPNVRFYYKTLPVLSPTGTILGDSGLTDIDNDFRHFGLRVSGANAKMLSKESLVSGAAVGAWAMGGAQHTLINGTTTFGSIAMLSEGFAGINSLGGAENNSRGYNQSGVVRPLALFETQVVADSQKNILYLGHRVTSVQPDVTNPTIQLIYLDGQFSPETLLPYSLKPGSALFTTDGNCTFHAFFATDGGPTCILNDPGNNGLSTLRLRYSDSSIPDGVDSVLDVPYIRRYIDPRTLDEKSYGFLVTSTNPDAIAPRNGSVLRLNQTGQSLSTTLNRNYQFDPGQTGGFGQVFSVIDSKPVVYGVSPNFNNKISDAAQAVDYVVYAALDDYSGPWIQSIDLSDIGLFPKGLSPLNTPSGSYFTYQDRNWYAAENNEWSALYYDTNYSSNNGPTKVAPNKSDSAFVSTSAIIRQETIASTWQGLVPDPLLPYYATPDSQKYVRGVVVPTTEFAAEKVYDDDDSSLGLGIIFKRQATDITTPTISDSVVKQTGQEMTPPPVVPAVPNVATFGRPEILELNLLSIRGVESPKEHVSVLRLTNNLLPGVEEYVRVINITSTKVQVIRNYYPIYYSTSISGRGWVYTPNAGQPGSPLPAVWPKGTLAAVCVETNYPEPITYDPIWSVSKFTMFRYFQLMGYAPALMNAYLLPQSLGSRIITNVSLPLSPSNGYAAQTAAWPIEFNTASSVLCSGHTWQYSGLFDFSRGLTQYQVDTLSRKQQYDFYSTAMWGGHLTVNGAQDKGDTLMYGSLREAVTGNYYLNESPQYNLTNRQIYQSTAPVNVPNPILVYSADSISSLFDGIRTTFDLTRAGYQIPTGQLDENGSNIIVNLGGVVQKPGFSYSIDVSQSQIKFTEAPPAKTTSDFRVISSEDDNQTLEVITLSSAVPFDGSTSSFPLTPVIPTVSANNTFVFLGGTEQNPQSSSQVNPSYYLSLDSTTLVYLSSGPQVDTTSDYRSFVSGSAYRSFGIDAFFVNSADDISLQFDGAKVSFEVTVEGIPVDPGVVNGENMFVSLGGVIQIPVNDPSTTFNELAYTFTPLNGIPTITFVTPPLRGTSCNIRIFTSSRYITCPLPDALTNGDLKVGPGIGTNAEGQIVSIDTGLIS